MTTKVYEVRVTIPFDETYFRHGTYTNLDLLLQHLEEEYIQPCLPLGDVFDPCEGEEVVVAELPLNSLTTEEKIVLKLSRPSVYDEEKDEYILVTNTEKVF